MKKIVEIDEQEGFEKLLGKRITVLCANYIYTGNLKGVNDDCILLTDGGIVYETGEWTVNNWKDYQMLPNDFYVMKGAIESFGVMK